ncbi:MAG: Shedu anti-phage system protein SduA domain-containing protein [Nostoc sp.]|uniref:Shedu anti-phage system protein SduA domain-containing protein n=1 Tax=Nostoc sp. TaxID=1180 RepID=UPI002FFA53F7
MKLYDRDYRILTSDEEAEFRLLKEQEVVKEVGSIKIRESLFHKYPKAVRHYISLFPNNYMDILELQDREELNNKLACFQQLLNSKDVNERSILKFINEHRAYFIIASLLSKYFDFGHHATYLFPEFQIGNSYRADYLIIGRSSGGHEFVFVEIEAPKGRITIAEGDLGEVFRKGIKQLRDWKHWLDRNYSSLKETFDKSKRADVALPDEFVTMDSSRFHFVVIAGKRSDFTNDIYEIRREERKDKNILLLHYDNLIDTAADVIGRKTY